jgi:hypothetical protein
MTKRRPAIENPARRVAIRFSALWTVEIDTVLGEDRDQPCSDHPKNESAPTRSESRRSTIPQVWSIIAIRTGWAARGWLRRLLGRRIPAPHTRPSASNTQPRARPTPHSPVRTRILQAASTTLPSGSTAHPRAAGSRRTRQARQPSIPRPRSPGTVMPTSPTTRSAI